MKIIEQIYLLGEPSKESKLLIEEIQEAISSYPLKLNPTKKGNGVMPIRDGFVKILVKRGWIKEHGMEIPGMRRKPLDGYRVFKKTRVGLEWETGNISSSFRAIMKLIMGLNSNQLDIAVLVLPSKKMYSFLTDRVGNIDELKPYVPGFQLIKLDPTKICILIAVEHDSECVDTELVKKGLDGMSLKRRKA
jgi:hypothetical protein